MFLSVLVLLDYSTKRTLLSNLRTIHPMQIEISMMHFYMDLHFTVQSVDQNMCSKVFVTKTYINM